MRDFSIPDLLLLLPCATASEIVEINPQWTVLGGRFRPAKELA